ncbi:MAG: DUF4127 family protein, partial [Armatimonadetes bacterium]|nr:DUF4127 family protein [Armatimonadota bacterium]
RPLREQVAATAANIGGEMADEGADITAVINCPLPVARDVVYHIPAYDSRKAALADLLNKADELSGGKGIAVIDAAFSDGADGAMMEAALEKFDGFSRLLTIASCGAPSASLGLGLSHAAMRLIALQDKGAFDLASLIADLTPVRYLALLDALIDSEKAHIELLFSRLVEDWLYHADIRPRVEDHLVRLVRSWAVDLRRLHEIAEEMVRDVLTAAAADLWIERFLGRTAVHIGMEPHRSAVVLADLEQTRIRLPWRRLAEVEVGAEFSVQLAAE